MTYKDALWTTKQIGGADARYARFRCDLRSQYPRVFVMKTVVATGVFDIIHPGHILFLSEAKKLGGRLVVIVARDKTTEKRKRKPLIPEDQRLEIVKALKPVDEAFLGEHEDFIKPVRDLKPDVIALGPNQEVDEEKLKEKLSLLGLKIEVVRIQTLWDGPLNASKKIHEKIKRI